MSVQCLALAFKIQDVSPSEKLVLLALANYADEEDQAWPSQRTLAKITCLSDRTIRTVLSALEERGLITREADNRADGSRSTDLVTLHLDRAQISGGAETVSGGVRKQLPGGAETVSGLTTFEPPINHQLEPITTINARAPVDPNDWARMLAEATAAAGDQLDRTSTGVMHAAELRALVEPKTGEPCEWSEVIAAIGMVRARSERTGRKIKSWAWVREDAIRLRDTRLGAAMPGVVVPMVPAGAGPPGLSLPARIGAEVDRATARAREMFERENANHG